ncbi:ComEA family DNA-binding protein [Flavobacterium sp.]|uniref:ComEA family DNA-binding protein n=1 Tax=Flavobacterium sp. TaxID=239 RepID=UPI002FDA7F67
MYSPKFLFEFTKEQRKGIFALFLILIGIQVLFFFVITNPQFASTKNKEDKEWMQMQSVVDSLKLEQSKSKKIFPFNPNFISDYKGYQLGMSKIELDKLFAFRKQNRYVNSAKEFQEVTGVSDSLLQAIQPYFKFPDWVNDKNKKRFENTVFKNGNSNTSTKPVQIIDLNQATQEDFIKIYGIGPALSERILKYKESLGGFVHVDQLNDVWGLNTDVLVKLKSNFQIVRMPNVPKYRINDLSLKELMKFPYFNYAIAKEIVTYRSMNGDLKSIEDLTKIKGISVEKINIIALYLEF